MSDQSAVIQVACFCGRSHRVEASAPKQATVIECDCGASFELNILRTTQHGMSDADLFTAVAARLTAHYSRSQAWTPRRDVTRMSWGDDTVTWKAPAPKAFEEVRLADLGLKQAALLSLEAAGFTRLEQMTDLAEHEVAKLRDVGRHTMATLRAALAHYGKAFRSTPVQ